MELITSTELTLHNTLTNAIITALYRLEAERLALVAVERAERDYNHANLMELKRKCEVRL